MQPPSRKTFVTRLVVVVLTVAFISIWGCTTRELQKVGLAMLYSVAILKEVTTFPWFPLPRRTVIVSVSLLIVRPETKFTGAIIRLQLTSETFLITTGATVPLRFSTIRQGQTVE